MRSSFCVFFGLAMAPIAAASQTLSVDILGPGESATLPPPGVVCMDVLVDVSDGDSWTAAGFRGETLNGASLIYAIDPNASGPVITNPGTHRRFVTFISEPRARDANGRFTNGGAAPAGRYCPTGATPEIALDVLNIAYFASPPETIGSPTVDGAVLRIALNLPPGANMDALVVYEGTTPPPLVTPYFQSVCQDNNPLGMCGATFDVPMLTGFNWGMGEIIPEPAAMLLVFGGLVLLRRRA